jgi:N6-L-threonylcarbamoyladenine synthase
LINDICASFQEAIVDVLVAKTVAAAREFRAREVSVSGGVSANSRLRDRLRVEGETSGFRVFTPPLEYCMDNGAMIAYVGWLRFAAGEQSSFEIPVAANLELT